MKILHSADFHLDTPFAGRSPEAVAQLRSALLQVPQKIVGLCKEHGCDVLLLAGDVFDGAATAESIHTVKTALKEVGIPTFISPGNHDFCSPDSPWHTESWPENVHIFTEPRITSVVIPELDCRVYGAGYQSMDCGALLEDFRAEGHERHHIAVLHGDPTQKNAPYCPISQAQVKTSGLDYLALGHIHKAGAFRAGATLCAWPGCPMGRGYDETGEKGVLLVTLEDTAATEFIPLDTPRFHDIEVEILSDPMEALQAALPAAGGADHYRVTFTGEWDKLDLQALQLPGFPHLELRDHTVPPTDLWACVGEDSLEGMYFKMLHDAMEGQDPETVDALTLAAKISRRILDGREVALP